MPFDYREFRTAPLPSQDEITATWPRDSRSPVVSIICTTYNHRDYIEDALRGFVLQKTRFPFEIIIHDDASTDGTAAVIRTWANRYPEIIKPICQTDNQYSRGRKVSAIAAARATGDYLALCEGDDFWTDRHKLEKQVAAMERCPDLQLSFHRCLLFNGVPAGATRSVRTQVAVIGFGEVIRGGGGFIPTPSIMVRREVMASLPAWFHAAPVGDYFIQMLGSTHGALYLPDVMASYRISAASSWSTNLRTAKMAEIEALAQRQDISLNSMRLQTNRQYGEDFRYARARGYRFYALQALIAGHPSLARRLVEKSWSIRRWTGLSQIVMYALRRWPALLLRLVQRGSTR